MVSIHKHLTVFVILAGLIACAGLEPAPDSSIPDPFEMPRNWTADSDPNTVQPWSRYINDKQLQALIDEAVTGNFDLQAAIARVDAARARVRISGADRYPQINIAATGARTKRSTNVFSVAKNPVTTYNLDTELTWEADIWGRLKASTQAAIADFKALESDFAAAKLSLAANISRSWFNAVEEQLQTELAERTVTSFQNSLSIIEQQFSRGIGEALDVRLARGNVATARANLYARQRRFDAALRALETLLGRYPGANLVISNTLPDIDNTVPTGLPSQLVSRRPDIRAAQWRLSGSQSRVVSAERTRFPRFTLTASGGTSSDSLRNLLDWDQLVWSVVTGITQPLFQGFRIKANVVLSQANNREAFANYAGVLLTAFSEVESTLAAEEFLRQQERALRNGVSEDQQAVELAEQQYRQGLVGIITLLESQRRAFNAESSLLQTINARLQNRVNLHLALGGDFFET